MKPSTSKQVKTAPKRGADKSVEKKNNKKIKNVKTVRQIIIYHLLSNIF